MRRFVLALSLTLLATAGFSHDRGHGRTINFDGESEFGDCNSNRVKFDGERAKIERQELAAGGLRSLDVRSSHGAVSVRGGNAYSIIACKAAASDAGLRAINVRLSGSELSASGPEDDWMVFYYITMPNGANLDVESTNGPVSVKDASGDIKVRAKNGPLSLRNLSGTLDAQTTNGPISISGGSGNAKVKATNGPLSVKLDGTAWDGSLEASTQNGPLSVKLPRGYRSGVFVEALGHGPVSCKAEGCDNVRSEQRRRDWDDEPRTFEFGTGTRNVRLSTVNGPVTIKDAE